VTALAFMPGVYEGSVVLGGQDGVVSVYDGSDLKPLWSADFHSSVLGVTALPGKHNGFVAALADGRAVVATGVDRHDREIREVKASASELRAAAALELAGRAVAAVTGLDRLVHLFDVITGAPLFDIELEGFGLSLTALGRWLGIGSSTGAMVAEISQDAARTRWRG
jgi:hypothetical protein